AEAVGLATHLVERDQPVVDIEDSVLDTLRDDRPGSLLEFQDELALHLPSGALGAGRKSQEQEIADEVEDRGVGARIAAPSFADRRFNRVLVAPADWR